MLPYHHQDVADVCAEDDYEARLEPRACRDGCIIDGRHVAEGERQYHYGGVGEHPLVDRDNGIAAHQRTEQGQVKRERELRAEAEQVAADVAHLRVGRRRTRHNEYHGPGAAYGHASRLLGGDRLLKYEESQYHGEDGHRGGHYAGVDGRSDAQPYGVAALVGHQAEHGGPYQHEQVFLRHVLLRRKQRRKPEQHRSASHAEGNHVDAGKAVGHGILAQRRHQSPKRASAKQAQVCYQRAISIHKICQFLIICVQSYTNWE